MPRPATGEIVEHKGKDGQMYRSLRFRAYGKRRTQPLGVVSRKEAEDQLRFVMADVARGTWQPPVAVEPPPEPVTVPTFHAFAEEWWTMYEDEWRPNTRDDYRWRLETHLLPYFGEMPMPSITGGVVKRYIAEKVAEGKRIRDAEANGEPIVVEFTDRKGRNLKRRAKPLSPRSINMTATLLGAILESAIDDDELGKLITHNAARGRRVKERAPRRSYLDAAGQIAALLDAASALDRKASRGRKHVERHAMIAVLIFAGLRIGELCALRWRDVDLAGGWLHTGSKTEAGRRKVKIRGALRDVLVSLRARRQDTSQDGYVFPTATNGEQSANNFRSRVLRAAVKRANADLAERDLPPLPDGLTPHSLRRTFCSLLYALGEDPGTVMDEMGHTDPALALRVYRQAMRRGEDEKAQLRALVEGGVWANMGERDAQTPTKTPERVAA